MVEKCPTIHHNGITFEYISRPRKRGDMHVWTDAAGSSKLGFGGYITNGNYFQIVWSDLTSIGELPWKAELLQ